jgi:hypothetical protein
MEKKTSYKQVEGHPDLVRDTTSHAIINTNVTAFEKAKNVLFRRKDNEMRFVIQQEI